MDPIDPIDPNELFRRIVRFIVDARRDMLDNKYPSLNEIKAQRERFTMLSEWTDSGRWAPVPVISDGFRFRWNPEQHCVESEIAPR